MYSSDEIIETIVEQMNDGLSSIEDFSKTSNIQILIRIKEKLLEAGFSEAFANELAGSIKVELPPTGLSEENIEKTANLFMNVIQRMKNEVTDKHFNDDVLLKMVCQFEINGN